MDAAPGSAKDNAPGAAKGTAPGAAPPLAGAAPSAETAAPVATLGGLQVGPPHIRKSLVYSLWDGILANAMLGLTETFAIAAAVALRAPAMTVALLSCLPILLGSLAQFFLPALIDPSRGRKPYVLRGVRLQSAFLFVAAAMGWLPEPYAVWGYLSAFVLAGLCGNAVAGLWVAWMGDLVPSGVRGRHFAWRNTFFAWSHLAVSLTAGLAVHRFTAHSAPWELFAVVFALAGLLRYVSRTCMERQFEPPPQDIEARRVLWIRPNRDFLVYGAAAALIQGAAALAGPFFSLWYLRDLHFNYFEFALAASCTVLGSILTLPLWGRLADTYGNRLTLRVSGFLICLVPLPSLFFSHPGAIWIINLFAGLSWAGYNLASFNYLLHAAGSRNRNRHIALASAMTGISIFAMTMLGGFLATRLPELFTWRLQTLFLVSACLRFATYAFFFPRFREDWTGKGSRDTFSTVPGYRMGLGVLRNAFRAFRGV